LIKKLRKKIINTKFFIGPAVESRKIIDFFRKLFSKSIRLAALGDFMLKLKKILNKTKCRLQKLIPCYQANTLGFLKQLVNEFF